MASSGNGNSKGPRELFVLPVLEKEETHPCFECTHCCNYIATEIDAPTTMKDYDYLLWYLYHKDVSVFVDDELDWYLQFTSRCEALTPTGMCGVYEERPAICREYSFTECEMAYKDDKEAEPAHKWEFLTSEDLLAWMQKQRPTTYKKFRAYKQKQKKGKNAKELSRVRTARSRAAAAGGR